LQVKGYPSTRDGIHMWHCAATGTLSGEREAHFANAVLKTIKGALPAVRGPSPA
jgi:hypothetical protein